MNKFKKALLIASAQVSFERPPAGLAFLSGICEHNNIEYDTFDLNLFIKNRVDNETWHYLEKISFHTQFTTNDSSVLKLIDQLVTEAAEEIVKVSNVDLYAFTVLSYVQIPWLEKLLEKLRPLTDKTFIAGGPGIGHSIEIGKSCGKHLGEQGLLDYWVIGEGDHTFDHFLKGQITPGVNSIEQNTDDYAPQIDDLSDIILPTYKKIKLDDYGSYSTVTHDVKNPPELSLLGSRGCVRRCTFCDVGHIWKKFRFRTGESVVEEIEKHYKETGTLKYHFTDSLINGSLSQFTSLMERLISLQSKYPEFKQLKYSGQFIIRPEKHHKEDMYRLMRDSGCDTLEVGIESGSQRVREHMGKKFSNEDIYYHFEMSQKYGIRNFLLLFPAYPTETIEDHEDTKTLLKNLQKYIINETVFGTTLSSPMSILTNTPIHSMMEDLGIRINGLEAYGNTANWTIDSNPSLTIKERYRRYLELSDLAINLRYPKGSADLTHIQKHLEEIKKELKKQKRVIPLKSKL